MSGPIPEVRFPHPQGMHRRPEMRSYTLLALLIAFSIAFPTSFAGDASPVLPSRVSVASVDISDPDANVVIEVAGAEAFDSILAIADSMAVRVTFSSQMTGIVTLEGR